MNRRITIAATVVVAVGWYGTVPCGAQSDTARPSEAAVLVLDTTGFWRMHHTRSTPVVQDGTEARPIPPQVPNKRGRGLESAMMLGMTSDFWPTKPQTEFFKNASGDLPWVSAGHYMYKALQEVARFGYRTSYFGVSFNLTKSLYGWKVPTLDALFERVQLDRFPMTRWRCLAEQTISANLRGVGRLGADTWHALKDKEGRRRGHVWERYPSANWGYLNVNSSLLAPGPDGAVATMALEILRENVQECEARILIERALTDETLKAGLGDDLIARCQAALDARRLATWRGLNSMQMGPRYGHYLDNWREIPAVVGDTWFRGSGWQERSETLYALAAEVAAKPAK